MKNTIENKQRLFALYWGQTLGKIEFGWIKLK